MSRPPHGARRPLCDEAGDLAGGGAGAAAGLPDAPVGVAGLLACRPRGRLGLAMFPVEPAQLVGHLSDALFERLRPFPCAVRVPAGLRGLLLAGLELPFGVLGLLPGLCEPPSVLGVGLVVPTVPTVPTIPTVPQTCRCSCSSECYSRK